MRPAPRRGVARGVATPVCLLAALAAALAALNACAAGGDPGAPETPAPDALPPWTFTSLYSHSSLSGGRPDWDTLEVRLQKRITPQILVGALVNPQRRPPDTDVGYGASLFAYPIPVLEWRSEVMGVPAAAFLPRQTYATGLEWRAGTRVSLALDYKRQNFSDGPINSWRPALTLWFSDETFLTARYTQGRAFGAQDFNAYAIVFNLGIPGEQRLTLTYAHGADPEKDPGIPGVILTHATTYAAYYRLPVGRGFDLIVGGEYEDRPRIYTRTTASVGVNARF